jgi:hypothetical protein
LIIAAARPFLAGIGAAVLADFFNLQALEQPPSVLVFVVAESLRLTIMHCKYSLFEKSGEIRQIQRSIRWKSSGCVGLVICVRFGPVNHSRQWAKTLPA